MNILYLTNHLNIGGISSYLLTLSKGMQKKGHNVYLASGPGELTEDFIQAGVICIEAPLKTKAEISLNVLISFFKLLPEIKKYNIDIIHANTRVTQVLAGLLEHYSRKPFVSTCHGFFKRRLTRRIFPCWGRPVIAISEEVRQHLIDDFKINPGDIRLIHNGIDIDKFTHYNPEASTNLRREIGLGNGPIVGIVARLSDVKGHIYLIRAMKTVLERFPASQLLIAGEGSIKDDLVKLSQEINIAGNIFFIPNAPDTRVVLSLIDIFVLPSLKEGLGLSLMEAMSMGKAVIGSDIGGIRTLLQHGQNGLLVKPANTRDLAAAIIELISDAEKRKMFAENARKFINNNFSQEKMVLETERVYSECVPAKL